MEKKIEITCHSTESMMQHPVLLFDKRRLQQVLLNLLTNAIKF